jgi:hypothetical protein
MNCAAIDFFCRPPALPAHLTQAWFLLRPQLPTRVSPPAQRIRTRLLSGIMPLQALLTVSQAQIALDGSLGPAGPLVGPNYRIDANVGQIRGSNLFHSFDQFSVPTGGSATFTGPKRSRTLWVGSPGGSRRPSMGRCARRLPGPICFCSIRVGSCLGPMRAWMSAGRFTSARRFFCALRMGRNSSPIWDRRAC